MTTTKRPVPLITDGVVRLRLLEAADLPQTMAWRNQDQIRRWFLNPAPILTEQHEAWFQQYRDRDDDFVFIIEDTGTLQRAIGQVSVYAIDWDGRRAKFGRLMIGDPEARGRGLAKRAVAALVNHAEREFGLGELRLEVLAGNQPAIAIYEGCGFTTRARDDREIQMVRRAAESRSTT